MQSYQKYRAGFLFLILWTLTVLPAVAGVSQAIQDQYKSEYENKVMFLRIPVYTEKQIVNITGTTYQTEPGLGDPLYKVGDKLRILRVDFGKDNIKFQLGAVASEGKADIIFEFDAILLENFPYSATFDKALQATFTDGLNYKDIEDAKINFLKNEFDRSVAQIANTASLDRGFVLEQMAPLIPSYRETQNERDSLKRRVEDISAQLTQSMAVNRRLESQVEESSDKLSRMQSENSSLQKKIDNTDVEISRLNRELQDANIKIQDFERQISGIQRSLNTEADSNRNLTRNNEELADRISALQKDLENQKEANVKLTDEIEDKNKEIRKKQSTINTLSSDKNSIGRKFVDLEKEKEKLDDFALAVDALRARIVEEKIEEGRFLGKADIYVENVRLGSLTWSIPSYLNYNESAGGEATFFAESIDSVKLTPEERHLLQTFGEKLKIRLDLAALSQAMTANSDEESEPRELGEREEVTWNWQISNKGNEDVSFLLSAYLINDSSREISLFRKEQTIASSNPVRRIRSHLQPIPLVVGIVLGFLLFGIVGIFRRPRKPGKTGPKAASPKPEEPKTYTNEKKL